VLCLLLNCRTLLIFAERRFGKSEANRTKLACIRGNYFSQQASNFRAEFKSLYMVNFSRLFSFHIFRLRVSAFLRVFCAFSARSMRD
jgi:hypothetical protein